MGGNIPDNWHVANKGDGAGSMALRIYRGDWHSPPLHTDRGGCPPSEAPLVVAHGVTDAGLCWTPVARALEADYDVIMVDARGHGQSDAPDTGYGPTELAADLHEGITGLGFHRPVILGHSMGAVTTLVLAGTYPDFPGMILLVDPPACWMPTPPPAPPDPEQSAHPAPAWDPKRMTREELIAQQAPDLRRNLDRA